jgi:LacI family transcriptional regulator
MAAIDVGRLTEDEARAVLEGIRWPEGPVCPHCGSIKVTRLNAKSDKVRDGVIQCNDCRGQFTVTVGTVMHRSHITLRQWVQAFYSMCSHKKGVSALQLQRNLGLYSYKSAWRLAHRIRAAMNERPLAGPLKGTVEVDETYLGGKPGHSVKKEYYDPKQFEGRPTMKIPETVLVETNGEAVSKPVERVDAENLKSANAGMKNLKRVALTIENSRAFGRELIRGIVRYSRLHGPWMFYRQDLFYVAQEGEPSKLEPLRQWEPQGIISRDPKNLEELEKWGIPLFVAVAMEPPSAKRNNVVTNDDAIGRMAAEHLLERGFHHFGYCGFDNIYWSYQRRDGFIARIAEAGFKTILYKQPKSRANRLWFREKPILAEWLRGLPKPIGIMACNDDRGQHITESCAIAKIEVPFDVAVIGVDNDEQVCDISYPSLSSVALDVEKAGFRASELLDKMMSGRKMEPQTVVVQPKRVVMRQSTNIVAVEDKLVSQALNFIHQNAQRLIQVEDVVKDLSVSRSKLHDKFMKTLGRTVYDEIKRVRIDLICQMLIETDLSISDIALSLGYDNTNHIARYFRLKMGMSPLEYRKLHVHQ